MSGLEAFVSCVVLGWISFAVSPDLAQTWLRQLLGPGLLRVPDRVYVLLTCSTPSQGLSQHQLYSIGHMWVLGLGLSMLGGDITGMPLGIPSAVFITYIFIDLTCSFPFCF